MSLRLTGFQNQAFFLTLRIEIMTSADGPVESIGTGFLVKVPVNETEALVLLVSNRHVFVDGSKLIRLTFCKGLNGVPVLGQAVAIGPYPIGETLVDHPDPDVDLACINISSIVNEHGRDMFARWLVPDLFATYEEDEIVAGSQVLFVGYPAARYDEANNLPIMRSGILATYPQADFNGLPQVVIDAQVFPGSSGSPVFMAVNNKLKLIGVVVQTMIKHERLVAIETATTEYYTHMLGLGIVYKSTAVRALLDHVLDKHHQGRSDRLGA